MAGADDEWAWGFFPGARWAYEDHMTRILESPNQMNGQMWLQKQDGRIGPGHPRRTHVAMKNLCSRIFVKYNSTRQLLMMVELVACKLGLNYSIRWLEWSVTR
jgi:hypothetical protein